MTANPPDTAFILAAGLGTRMRPLTDKTPKPMLEVGGIRMIDYAIQKLADIGVQHVIINTHYLSDVIESHLKNINRPRINISNEPALLDTGGGIKNVLPQLGEKPFYVLAGDSIWTDGPDSPALKRLAEHWSGDKMDMLLLLQPVDKMTLTKGVGDYDVNPDGTITRSLDQSGAYMFTSLRILSPRVFESSPNGIFSLLPLMDHAEKRGRLHGLIHDGDWHHISTPADLQRVNADLGDLAQET